MYVLRGSGHTTKEARQEFFSLSYEYPGGNCIYIGHCTVHILLRVYTIYTDTRPYSEGNMYTCELHRSFKSDTILSLSSWKSWGPNDLVSMSAVCDLVGIYFISIKPAS